jgi:hypothetical protein
MALISIGAWSGSASAAPTYTIDFQDFGAGETSLGSLRTDGGGISGPSLAGAVSLTSVSAGAPGPHMIFDAACPGGCTGGDVDLFVPGLGKVLIYSEDGDSADPDDCELCSPAFTFNFSGLGTGVIAPESITVLDQESGGAINLLGSGAGLPVVIPIPATADGGSAIVDLTGFSGVTTVIVSLIGSGAVDNLAFSQTPPPPPPPPPSGMIRIQKSIVSAAGGTPDNPSDPSLEGFEFEVLNQNNVVIWTFSTDAGGRAQTVIGLPLGNYTITESDAQGLTNLTGPIAITLTSGLTTVDWVNQQSVVAAPAVDIELATNGSDADLPADAVGVEVDSAVTWTMVVTNTGNTPLTNVTVTGPDAGSDDALIIDGITLASAATASYARVGVAEEGLVGKLALVTSDEGVSDSDPSHYRAMSEPGVMTPVADVVFTVDIELATNGEDADLETQAATVPLGGVVVWTYVVTNTGPERLTDIVVVDDNGTPGDRTDDFIVASGFALSPAATVTFRIDGGPPLTGLFGNHATVDTAEGATDVDPSHYITLAGPTMFPNAGSGGLPSRSGDHWVPLASAGVAALASIALLARLRPRRKPLRPAEGPLLESVARIKGQRDSDDRPRMR